MTFLVSHIVLPLLCLSDAPSGGDPAPDLRTVAEKSGFKATATHSQVMDLARQIGTYETSILPYADCCQLLLARSPETRCTAAEIADCEQQLPVDRHHEDVGEETEVHDVVWPDPSRITPPKANGG